MPAERWKWRQRLSAWVLGPRLASLAGERLDCVVVGGLTDLAHLRVASRLPAETRFLLYMHENQLSYPRPSGQPLERTFAVGHVASLLSADGVAFNSRSHREAMREAMDRFLAEVPAPAPRGLATRISRARVVYPGVDLDRFPEPAETRPVPAPTIVWNHRWEEDKRPSAFARIVLRLAERGLEFRLVLLGTGTQVHPTPLHLLREKLGSRILRDGPTESRADYIDWLSRSDISLSTAVQENFGYSVVEAMAAGAVPLLPDRLSYRELLTPRLARELIYDGTDAALGARLAEWVEAGGPPRATRALAMRAARRFDWSARVGVLDDWVEEACS